MSDKKFSRRKFLGNLFKGTAAVVASQAVDAIAGTVKPSAAVMNEYNKLTGQGGTPPTGRQQPAQQQQPHAMPVASGDFYPAYDGGYRNAVRFVVDLPNNRTGQVVRHEVNIDYDTSTKRGIIRDITMGVEGKFTMGNGGSNLNGEIKVDRSTILAQSQGMADDPDVGALLSYLGEIAKGVEKQEMKRSTAPDGPGPVTKVKGGFVQRYRMGGDTSVVVFRPEGEPNILACLRRPSPFADRWEDVSVEFAPYSRRPETDLNALASVGHQQVKYGGENPTVGMSNPANDIQYRAAQYLVLAHAISALTHARSGYERGEAPQQTGIFTYRTSDGRERDLLDASVKDQFTRQPFIHPNYTVDGVNMGNMTTRQFETYLLSNLDEKTRNLHPTATRPMQGPDTPSGRRYER